MNIVLAIIIGFIGGALGTISPASSILFYLLIHDIDTINDADVLGIYLIMAMFGTCIHERMIIDEMAFNRRKIIEEIRKTKHKKEDEEEGE